jgi:hypothetical protein
MRATGLSTRALLCMVITLASSLRGADPPRGVIDFFDDVTRALVESHTDNPGLPISAAAFLDKFDSAMPGFAELRENVEDLVSRSMVGSALEFVTDDGDENKRTLDVDWTLEIEDRLPRRQVLKCTIERRGKTWKITSLAPVDFFKY